MVLMSTNALNRIRYNSRRQHFYIRKCEKLTVQCNIWKSVDKNLRAYIHGKTWQDVRLFLDVCYRDVCYPEQGHFMCVIELERFLLGALSGRMVSGCVHREFYYISCVLSEYALSHCALTESSPLRTCLETRTKESNMYANHWDFLISKGRYLMKVKVGPSCRPKEDSRVAMRLCISNAFRSHREKRRT